MAGWLVPALGLGGALTAGGLAWWASRTTFGPRAASPTESTPTTPNAASASGWRLRYVRGEGAGTVLPWPGVTLTLGAGAGNDVVLSGPGISGRHARLERFGSGAVFVTDNDSANGTWVDGDRLELGERRLLRPGQRLSLGQDLELELLGPETPP